MNVPVDRSSTIKNAKHDPNNTNRILSIRNI